MPCAGTSANHAQKKSVHYAEQDSPEVVEATRHFLEQLEGVEPEQLLFGDQMGCNRAMTPTHGRAPAGQRVDDEVPAKRGTNVSTMGVLGLAGLLALTSVEGAFNADLVYDFIESEVVPKLEPGQVLILDNARIHKKREAELRLLLARRGCRLLFLPPYSPEWNPIENAWSKMKGMIKRLKARTREALLAAIRTAASALTPEDASGWFRLCGHA